MAIDAIGSSPKVERVERPNEDHTEQTGGTPETDTTDHVTLGDPEAEDEPVPTTLLKGMADNYEPPPGEPGRTLDPQTGLITVHDKDGSVIGVEDPASGLTSIYWGEKGKRRTNPDYIQEHEPISQEERDRWLADQTRSYPLGTSTAADGSEITEYEDRTEIRQPDGTSIVRRPDGSELIVHPDGAHERVRPDGDHEWIYPDGSAVVVRPDGSRHRLPGGIENPDGSFDPIPLPEEMTLTPAPAPSPPTPDDIKLPDPVRLPDGPPLKYPRLPDGPAPTPPRLPDAPLPQPNVGPIRIAPVTLLP